MAAVYDERWLEVMLGHHSKKELKQKSEKPARELGLNVGVVCAFNEEVGIERGADRLWEVHQARVIAPVSLPMLLLSKRNAHLI